MSLFPASLRQIRHTILHEAGVETERLEEIEPLAADVREKEKESPRYRKRTEKIRLIARVLACRFDELRQREQERQARRLLYFSASALALLIAVSALAGWAIYERNKADINAAEASRQQGIAETNAVKAKEQEDLAKGKAEEAKGHQSIAEFQKRQADEQRDNASEVLGRLQVANGLQLADNGDLFGSLLWFAEVLRWDQANLAREEMHRVRLETYLRHSPRLVQVWFHEMPANYAEFSPDGHWVAIARGRAYGRGETNGEARIYDAATGSAVTPPLRHSGTVYSASFSPDGRWLVTASGDKTARVWDTASGEPRPLALQHQGVVRRAFFSPDGRRIVTASDDQTARLWDAASGEPLTPPLKHDRAVWHVVFSSDSRLLLTTTADPYKKFQGTARIWDTSTGQPVTQPMMHGREGNWIYHASFSPDGSKVVTAGSDKLARVWDAMSGNLINSSLRHEDRVTSASFSPDGSRVLTASWDGTARIWDRATIPSVQGSNPPAQLPPYLLLRHGGRMKLASFSPDGRHVVTISTDQTARVWDAKTGQPITPPLLYSGSPYNQHGNLGDPGENLGDEFSVFFDSDGRRLVTAGWDGTTRVWDLASEELAVRPLKSTATLMTPSSFSIFGPSISISPDGRRVLTIRGGIRIWDVATRLPITPLLEHNDSVLYAFFSSDGRRVVTTTGANYAYKREGVARIWDAETGQALTPPMKHENGIPHAFFSRDGRWLVTASYDKTARVWDTATGKPISQPLAHASGVIWASFSPSGDRVVTASEDKTARPWDAKTAQPLGAPLKHDSAVTQAIFSPNGLRIATASGGYDRGIARVWDAGTGAEVRITVRHGDHLNHVSFSPDSRRIVTASSDYTARIWNATTGEPITPPLRHEMGTDSVFKEEMGVTSAAFSSDGRWVVTGGSDQTARVWNAVTGQPISPPFRHSARVKKVFFTDDRRYVISETSDGVAWIWKLFPERRELERLAQLSQLLSTRKVDLSGTVVSFEVNEFRKTWEKMRLDHSEEFLFSKNGVLAWHERQALVAEKDQDWTAAIFHLDRLISLNPTEWPLYARRGFAYACRGHQESTCTNVMNLGARRGIAHPSLGEESKAIENYSKSIELGADDWKIWVSRGTALAKLGFWDKAAIDYARASKLEAIDNNVLIDYALLQLKIGDTQGYRKACAKLTDRLGNQGEGTRMLEEVLRTLLLNSESVPNFAPLVRMVESWMPERKDLLGAALYRTGQFEAALEVLQNDTMRGSGATKAWQWFFLAMIHYRLDHHDQAKEWLDKAIEATFDKEGQNLFWWERVEIESLLSESKDLILD